MVSKESLASECSLVSEGRSERGKSGELEEPEVGSMRSGDSGGAWER